MALVAGSPLGDLIAGAAYGGGVLLLCAAMLVGAGFAAMNMRGQRVGLRVLGLLHPAADGLKTAFKEDIIPLGVDRLMYGLAPWLAFFPSLVVLAVIPFGNSLCFCKTPDGHLDIHVTYPDFPGVQKDRYLFFDQKVGGSWDLECGWERCATDKTADHRFHAIFAFDDPAPTPQDN